jgi:hypothetical protein
VTLPWFRADTNLPTHDKIIDLVGNGQKGKAAGFVYFTALAMSVGNESDGVIKKAMLPWVHGTTADANLLVDCGLWVAVDGGWRIRNYGTRQVVGASEQVKAEEISAVRSAAGKTGASNRWKGN